MKGTELLIVMERLVRGSDILVFDAIMRGNKAEFNIIDIILSHTGILSGAIISSKGIIGAKYYVKAKDIEKLTSENIIIKGYSPLKLNNVKDINFATKNLKNKKVISSDGLYMGILSDFYIHMDKMQVMAVEVARSFFEDLFTGRLIIPGNIISTDNNSIIIRRIQLENKLHNTKGIINAIDESINRN